MGGELLPVSGGSTIRCVYVAHSRGISIVSTPVGALTVSPGSDHSPVITNPASWGLSPSQDGAYFGRQLQVEAPSHVHANSLEIWQFPMTPLRFDNLLEPLIECRKMCL